MKSRSNLPIKSFHELVTAKQKLKEEIEYQEEEILQHPLYRIPSTLLQGGGIKSSVESVSLEDYKKAAIKLLSAVLMANKHTRKFFVGFIIAKEMVPFIVDKVNEYIKQKN